EGLRQAHECRCVQTGGRTCEKRGETREKKQALSVLEEDEGRGRGLTQVCMPPSSFGRYGPTQTHSHTHTHTHATHSYFPKEHRHARRMVSHLHEGKKLSIIFQLMAMDN